MNELMEFLADAWRGIAPWLQSLIIFGGGLALAFVARFLLTLLLRLIRFDVFCQRIGLSEFLRKGGTDYAPARLVGVVAFWVIVLVVFLEISRLLGLEVITVVYGKFLGLIPGLIAAAFILVGGWVILGFLANFVVTVARNAGSMHARLIGRLIRYSGLLLIIILAVSQVEIGTGILSTMLLVFFAAICFGIALAIGLGCQDVVRDLAQRIVRNLREQSRNGKSGDLEG